MNYDFRNDPHKPLSLDSALEDMESAQLVRRLQDGEPAYWFKHVLTQETVYASLLRQDRRALHRLLGDTYQALFANQLDDYLLPLANHYAEAGETAQAFRFLVQYGERAMKMSAYPEAIGSFQRALGLLPAAEHTLRAQTLVSLGDIYCRRAEFETANETFGAALDEAERGGDEITAAAALSGAGRVASQQGAHEQARALGERALEFARAANDSEALARAHRQLGISYNLEGDNALAQEHLNAALELYGALGDEDGTGSALNSLGIVAREQHELEQAKDYFEQALTLSQRAGDKYSTGVRLNNLGVVAEQRGDLTAATRYQEQAQAIAREIGDREGAALTEINLGSLAMASGDMAQALSRFQHALAELTALDSVPYALYALAAFAKLEVSRGRLEHGAELLGLALGHAATTGDIAIDFDAVRCELEGKLGAERADAAMARGRAMALREAVEGILAQRE